jgi:starch synthase
VTRAVSQKLGLFTEDWKPGIPVMTAYLNQGTALLVVGTGELEDKLEPLNDHPAALFLQVFDAPLATKLYAAGDLFLMPSDFEPCGISQLMALRYGCLPLVHDRGGLHDTVIAGKTGFVFRGRTRKLAKDAFLKSAAEAVVAIGAPGYEHMVKEAMGQRFDWNESVQKYNAIYQEISSRLLDPPATAKLVSRKPRQGKGAS